MRVASDPCAFNASSQVKSRIAHTLRVETQELDSLGSGGSRAGSSATNCWYQVYFVLNEGDPPLMIPHISNNAPHDASTRYLAIPCLHVPDGFDIAVLEDRAGHASHVSPRPSLDHLFGANFAQTHNQVNSWKCIHDGGPRFWQSTLVRRH
jgi:hypothetical protein